MTPPFHRPEAGPPRPRPPFDGPRTFGSVQREHVPLRTPDGPLRARVPGHRLQPDRPAPPWRPDNRGRMARFIDRFGWRAYALPILAVATVLGLSNIALGGQPKHQPAAAPSTTSGAPTSSAPPRTTPSPTPSTTPSPTGALPTAVPTNASIAALPSGSASYPDKGDGTFAVVPGTSATFGSGPLKRFAVEVEGGMSGLDDAAFAAVVTQTLSDPRGWIHGGISLRRVDSGRIDFRVTLTSVQTIRKKCGYTMKLETSCSNAGEGREFINVARWVRGAMSYGLDVADYRHYVINHEVGHALGHGHVKCPKAGNMAPIMMEQTLGVTTPGVGACRPNPWPYVHGKLATGPPTTG